MALISEAMAMLWLGEALGRQGGRGRSVDGGDACGRRRAVGWRKEQTAGLGEALIQFMCRGNQTCYIGVVRENSSIREIQLNTKRGDSRIRKANCNPPSSRLLRLPHPTALPQLYR